MAKAVPAKSKVFTIWPFKKKFVDPWSTLWGISSALFPNSFTETSIFLMTYHLFSSNIGAK